MKTCQKFITESVLLSTASTFGIGGPADYFCEPTTIEEVQAAIQFATDKKIPYFPIGKGSNCLFDDAGFRGLIVRIKLDTITLSDTGLCCVGAGYSFAQLGRVLSQAHYSGLEFASGIPATVGGAIYMNAGASNRQTQDCLVDVDVITQNSTIENRKKKDIIFSYRSSSFQKTNEIILQARFQLTFSATAKQVQKEIVERRVTTQPYKDKSIGCIFKNPQHHISSGKLIECAGLKGVSVGGASVSTQHANFIINRDHATAQDVRSLMKHIKHRVFIQTGYHLETEIRMIDQWGNSILFHHLL